MEKRKSRSNYKWNWRKNYTICVGFIKNERLVGNEAKSQAIRNYKNTVYDAKRLIGRKYDDPQVQKDIKLWPFKVIKGDNNKPKIEVEYKGKTEYFYPEEI